MAVGDVDNDGVSDVVVAEQGFVEVFTRFFLINNKMTAQDRIGDPTKPNGALKTASNNIVSIALGRINSDAFLDIVVAEKGDNTGQFEVFSTGTLGKLGSAGPPQLLKGFLMSSSPRAIAIQQTNLIDPSLNLVDTDMDVIVVSTSGIEIFENIS